MTGITDAPVGAVNHTVHILKYGIIAQIENAQTFPHYDDEQKS